MLRTRSLSCCSPNCGGLSDSLITGWEISSREPALEAVRSRSSVWTRPKVSNASKSMTNGSCWLHGAENRSTWSNQVRLRNSNLEFSNFESFSTIRIFATRVLIANWLELIKTDFIIDWIASVIATNPSSSLFYRQCLIDDLDCLAFRFTPNQHAASTNSLF